MITLKPFNSHIKINHKFMLQNIAMFAEPDINIINN